MKNLKNTITTANRYFTYSEYKELVNVLFDQDKVTGPNQSEALLDSTKMSIQRMKKWDKIYQVPTELQSLLDNVKDSWTWYLISEGWCGDAAQIIPVISKIADHSSNIDLKILLRDENPEIMNEYLTNGAMAIPILVAVNNETGEELAPWGPRPEDFKQRFKQTKEANPELPKGELYTQLHLWYAKDRGAAIESDLREFVENHIDRGLAKAG